LRTARDEPVQNAALAVLVSPAISHFLSDIKDSCRVIPAPPCWSYAK
jgi:hypothetical protein